MRYEVVIKGLCGEGLLDESRELPNLAMRYDVRVTPAFLDFLADVFKSVWKVFPKILFILCKVLEIRGFFLKNFGASYIVKCCNMSVFI